MRGLSAKIVEAKNNPVIKLVTAASYLNKNESFKNRSTMPKETAIAAENLKKVEVFSLKIFARKNPAIEKNIERAIAGLRPKK